MTKEVLCPSVYSVGPFFFIFFHEFFNITLYFKRANFICQSPKRSNFGLKIF